MAREDVTFRPGALCGCVRVPGDKSISHRALIAGVRTPEPLRVTNLNPGRDVRATREALVALGARIYSEDDDAVVGAGSLIAPSATLDCMNSGSTARMVLGACAGANIQARFDGDQSLRRRPMEPVAAQLRAFGAKIDSTHGRLPLQLFGTPQVQTRHFILLAPSAQVKSALLFAGLFGGVPMRIDGDRASRDHTERLLHYLGAEIEWSNSSVTLAKAQLHGGELEVAGDMSAAAFFITAATITPGSSILVKDVGVNPTRTGLIEALQRMGGAIELRDARTRCGEPIADVVVRHAPLTGVHVSPDLALRAIDEIPLLAIAGAFALGVTTIAGVADLRSKESDRIGGVERLLNGIGIHVGYERGTLRIQGGEPSAPLLPIDAQRDHRIAMAAAILGCAAGPLAIDSADSLDVSFPGFIEELERLQRP